MRLISYLLAVVLALPTVLLCLLIGSSLTRDALAMLLVVIAAIYLGFGLADGSARAIATEIGVSAIF